MKYIILSSVIVLLSACSSVSEKKFETLHLYDSKVQLLQGKKISIETPLDGKINDTIYHESGVDTAKAFKQELEKYAHSVTLLPLGCAGDSCINLAKNSNSDYLIELDLMHWEDRSTNWSGKLDRLNIEIKIHELNSGRVLVTDYIHTNTALYSPRGGLVEGYLPIIAAGYVPTLFQDD